MSDKCPYCKTECNNAEYVHNGLGLQQVTPNYCDNCGAIQISPYDSRENLTGKELATNWYEPRGMESDNNER